MDPNGLVECSRALKSFAVHPHRGIWGDWPSVRFNLSL